VICRIAVIPLSFVSVGDFTFREFTGVHMVTKAFEPRCFIAFQKPMQLVIPYRLGISNASEQGAWLVVLIDDQAAENEWIKWEIDAFSRMKKSLSLGKHVEVDS